MNNATNLDHVLSDGAAAEPSAPRDDGADTGTIAWLLPEIVNAFDAATASLRTFRAQAAGLERSDVDLGPLRVARSHLHQAHGALELSGLSGVVRLTEAMEALLAAFAEDPSRCDATALDAITGGCRSVVEYLEDLRAGVRQQPLHLYASYRDLLLARQADRVHPADLFAVDLTVRPPRDESGTALDAAGLADQRRAFEQSLLRYLRNENDQQALTGLAAATTAIERSVAVTAKAGHPQLRAFWWVARALFEALAHDGFAQTRSHHALLKRLAGRVNLQIRKLAEGSGAVAERLFADTLFFVAIAEPVTPHVRDVQSRYRLDETVTRDFEIQRYGRIDASALKTAREALVAAKTSWAAIVAGDVEQIKGFARETAALLDATGSIKRRGLAQVAQVIDGIATDLGFDPRQPAAAVGLDVATALLFLEGALDRARALDDAFDERAQLVVARLESSALGQDHTATPIDWLDRMSRAAEERLTVATFAAELQANLRHAEKVLDAFFRDPAQRAELPEADAALSQASGALALLGHDDAHLAIDHARGRIAAFRDETQPADTAAFEALAQSLGAVGFYVDQIKRERIDPQAFRFDRATGQFSAAAARPAGAAASAADPAAAEAVADASVDAAEPATAVPDEFVPRPPMPHAAVPDEAVFDPFAATEIHEPETSLEDEMVRRADEAGESAARLVDGPDDAEVRSALVAALTDVRRHGQVIDDNDLVEEASGALALLRASGAIDVHVIAETVGRVRARALRAAGQNVPSIAPSAPAVAVPTSDNVAAVDAELLEIFLEEAGDVLRDADASMRVLDADPENDTATQNLRRGFHTLKGSSRMVGLSAFGEAAWSIEEILNGHLAEEGAASSDLRALVDYAVRYLSSWVSELRDTGTSTRIPDALIEAARVVRAGGSPGIETAPALMPSHAVPAFDVAAHPLDGSRVPPVADESSFAKTELFDEKIDAPLEFFGAQPVRLEDHPVDGFDLLIDGEAVAEEAPDTAASPEVGHTAIEATSFDPFATSIDDAPFDLFEADAAPAPMDEPVVEAPSTARDDHPFVDNVVPFVPFHSAPTATTRTDDVRRIGSLTVSLALFNIYLAEADELLRVLTQDFSEWRHERDRHVSENAMRAAHSLSGSSATVGLAPAHDLASAIEAVLQSLWRNPVMLADEQIGRLQDAVESLRRMLHRFATERMPEPDAVRLASIVALLREVTRHEDEGADEAPSPAALPFEPLDFGEPDARHDVLGPVIGSTDAAPDEAPNEAPNEAPDEAPDEAPNETLADLPPEAIAQPGVDRPELVETASGVAGVSSVDDAQTLDPEALLAARRAAAIQRESTVQDDIDPDLVDVFIAEGGELLPQIGTHLRTWQANPANPASSRMLLRSLHTLKGSARMAGAMRLGEVVHDIETRIEAAAKLHTVPAVLFDDLLAAHDRSLELFDQVQRPELRAAELAAQAAAHAANGPQAANEAELAVTDAVDPVATAEAVAATAPGARSRDAKPTQQAVRVASETLDRLVNLAGEVSISRARIENEVQQIKGAMGDLSENVDRLRSQLREIELQAEFQMQSRMQSQQSTNAESDKFDPLEFDRFTRFQELTRMMAESVNDVKTIQQNLQKSLDVAETDLASQRRMTRDLQQDLMQVRMVPFSSIAERLYRVARRAAKEVDKRVNLDIRGGAVEIDRGVLERMVGPFEHLLRNHIVHGIENRDVRRAGGKGETGELLVEARQEGNEIVLSFSDDGAGLDRDRIRAKARELRLIDGEITDAQAAELIFHPGFSTASAITELAGRGVGMDVVRTEAQELGGRVQVDSEAGHGTRFTIHLPLTLAITQVVLIAVANRVYALPAVLVEQVQQMRSQPLADAYRAGKVDWAGSDIPLAFLGTLLGLDDSVPTAQRISPVLILRSAGERMAVHVDEVVANQEVVVKNLGPQLARMTGIVGATVLGSGEIVLILNPVQLAQIARPEQVALPVQQAPSFTDSEVGLLTLPTVMVVDDSLTVRRVTQRLLAREGYQVVLAKDGVDALEQLQEFPPDVMLVDIEMPRMDGFDLTRNVRNDARYRHIPIIMITSRTAEKHRRHAAELGVDAYLGKPYQEDELLALLKTHVAGRKLPA